MSDLSQNEWASQLESDSTSIILDVRTDAEVEEGMIPEAKHLDIHQGQGFISALEKLDKTNTYYVYCRSGARSGQRFGRHSRTHQSLSIPTPSFARSFFAVDGQGAADSRS